MSRRLVVRGGSVDGGEFYMRASFRFFDGPSDEGYNVGFRVASASEPGSIALLVCGAIVGLIWWRRRA